MWVRFANVVSHENVMPGYYSLISCLPPPWLSEKAKPNYSCYSVVVFFFLIHKCNLKIKNLSLNAI